MCFVKSIIRKIKNIIQLKTTSKSINEGNISNIKGSNNNVEQKNATRK